jgi:hypothetical protein
VFATALAAMSRRGKSPTHPLQDIFDAICSTLRDFLPAALLASELSTLLKPKRACTLRLLLTWPAREIKIRGQLVGCEVKEFKLNQSSRESTLLTAMAGIAGKAVAAAALIAATYFLSPNSSTHS